MAWILAARPCAFPGRAAALSSCSRYRYELTGHAYDHGAPPPRLTLTGTVLAEHSVQYDDAAGCLTLDLRGYPSKAKTLWTFALSPVGTLSALEVARDGGAARRRTSRPRS